MSDKDKITIKHDGRNIFISDKKKRLLAIKFNDNGELIYLKIYGFPVMKNENIKYYRGLRVIKTLIHDQISQRIKSLYTQQDNINKLFDMAIVADDIELSKTLERVHK